MVVAELLWPGAQLCLLNYPKEQPGYFQLRSIGVVPEPGGLAVGSLGAAISGRDVEGLPLPTQGCVSRSYDLGMFSLLGLGRREWICRRVCAQEDAATAVGVTPAQPGTFIPNISTL